MIYIILMHYETNIYNIGLAIFFAVISVYTMIAGTEYHHFTYIPLLTIFFLTLRKNEQLRIFNHFVTILSVIFLIGLVSYMLSLVHLNVPIGTAISQNPSKSPYYVYIGFVKESELITYRFSSIFDEAGVVGTLSGLILSAIGISTKNFRSMIILLAGLVSFSLAFYVILILNLVLTLNIKKFLLVIIILAGLIFASGNLFNNLIGNRLAIQDKHLAGDNRTNQSFDDYYDLFVAKGGSDLFFGKGVVGADKIDELTYASTYKLIIINFGIIGFALIISFYGLCVFSFCNSRKGWFLFVIFVISAYQRPDLFIFYNIVMFIGGLRFIELTEKTTDNALLSSNHEPLVTSQS